MVCLFPHGILTALAFYFDGTTSCGKTNRFISENFTISFWIKVHLMDQLTVQTISSGTTGSQWYNGAGT